LLSWQSGLDPCLAVYRAILLAAALVIILKPVYTWLLNKRGINGRDSRATAITILIFFLIIAIPAVVIIGGAITQAAYLFSGLDIEGLDFSLREINVWLEKTLQTIVAGSIHLDEVRFAESLSQAIAWFSEWVINILISLGQSLPSLFTNARLCW
jgi:predicted PurR-regulated permease PerM